MFLAFFKHSERSRSKARRIRLSRYHCIRVSHAKKLREAKGRNALPHTRSDKRVRHSPRGQLDIAANGINGTGNAIRTACARVLHVLDACAKDAVNTVIAFAYSSSLADTTPNVFGALNRYHFERVVVSRYYGSIRYTGSTPVTSEQRKVSPRHGCIIFRLTEGISRPIEQIYANKP